MGLAAAGIALVSIVRALILWRRGAPRRDIITELAVGGLCTLTSILVELAVTAMAGLITSTWVVCTFIYVAAFGIGYLAGSIGSTIAWLIGYALGAEKGKLEYIRKVCFIVCACLGAVATITVIIINPVTLIPLTIIGVAVLAVAGVGALTRYVADRMRPHEHEE